MEEAMKAMCYLNLPLTGKKGELNDSFISKLQEIIEETFPVKKGYREKSEKATLTVNYPNGQVRVTLFRCLVVDSCSSGNNMTITYKTRGKIGHHFYNRYYLHGRESDIVDDGYYQFLSIDGAILVRRITKADKQIRQETINNDKKNLEASECVEKERTNQPES